MFIERIETLRKKPKAVRNRYAFGFALTTTMLIAIVWGIGLPARLGNSVAVSEETKADRAEMGEQFMQLRDLVTDSVSEIKSQAELVGATVNSTSTAELLNEFASSTLSATNTDDFIAAFASTTLPAATSSATSTN